jgi:hypothetical protein
MCLLAGFITAGKIFQYLRAKSVWSTKKLLWLRLLELDTTACARFGIDIYKMNSEAN